MWSLISEVIPASAAGGQTKGLSWIPAGCVLMITVAGFAEPCAAAPQTELRYMIIRQNTETEKEYGRIQVQFTINGRQARATLEDNPPGGISFPDCH